MYMNMPDKPATTSPKHARQWLEYWREKEQAPRSNSVAYRKAYYANKTRLRQIAKMHELMDLYPADAKAHTYPPARAAR